ncbi:MAG: sigma-70 family RNA polymerase sigma factor [Bacteroidota bacterium]
MSQEHSYASDKLLWLAVQKGRPDAFRELYLSYADLLYNYGCKMNPDRELVKDSMQDVFPTLWEKRQDLHIKTSVKSYLFQMFRRDLIHKLQRTSRELIKEEDVGFELSIESKIIMDEAQIHLRQQLHAAVKTLTPRQKEILFLRFYEKLPYEEISDLMALNRNSMYKLLSAAIKRLKDQLTCLIPATGILLDWLV